MLKEAGCKRIHTVLLHIYEVPEQAKLICSKKNKTKNSEQWLPRVQERTDSDRTF